MSFFISNILAYSFEPSWWELEKGKRESILNGLREALGGIREGDPGALKAEIYSSLRYDCNIIFWLLLKDTKEIVMARSKIEKGLGRHASVRYGFLSTYEQKRAKEIGDRGYFVAYPISKNPEWYLLGEQKRSDVMAEHIRLATGDANNKGIISYTTTSFGIDDNEFVVLYELDSIPEWVLVTKSLREAEARRWITNEKPILVGSKGNFDAFLI